jgi:endonuclease-3
MQKNVKEVISILKKDYGKSETALNHKNILELLVATMLSAQCTDARVNIVTKNLFKKYKTVKDYADANLKTFEQEIRSTGFYHNKAKNINAMAKMLIVKFNSQVPKTMDELIELPGVARKTANIVLTYGYGIVSGIAVDTHVFRLSQRLRWSKGKTAENVEQDLMKLIDKKDWGIINHLLVMHGRKVCNAKKPLCSKCHICKYCPSYKKIKGWC